MNRNSSSPSKRWACMAAGLSDVALLVEHGDENARVEVIGAGCLGRVLHHSIVGTIGGKFEMR